MAVRSPLDVVTLAAVVFFFSLEVALARPPLPSNENEIAVATASDSLTVPSSEVKAILRLPSDTVNDESHPDPDSQVRDTQDPELAEPITVRSVPLTVLTFHDLRPINRHFFPVRSRLPLRNCRHHHHRHHHDDHAFLKPVEKQAAKIPYGNDMVLYKGEEKRDLEIQPVSWVRLPYHRHHHYHHQDDFDGFSKYLLKRSHRFGKERLKKHFHHKHRDDEVVEVENEEKKVKEQRNHHENGEKKESGFVKRIRKFLNHF